MDNNFQDFEIWNFPPITEQTKREFAQMLAESKKELASQTHWFANKNNT